MVETNFEPVAGFDFAVVRGRRCYFIDDVGDVAGICRRQVDREIQRKHLTRIKRGQLSFVQVTEVHALRDQVHERQEEVRHGQR